MGDGQHGWAIAEWLMLLRNFFVMEEEGALRIGLGILPEWLETRTLLSYGPTLTPYGRISVEIEGQKETARVSLTAKWSGDARPAVTACLPGYANLCNRVIAPSTSVKNLQLRRGVKTAIQVLPTGVDVNFFAGGNGKGFREKHQIAPETRVIGHIGRLAREKNLPYLAKTVAGAIDQKPGSCFLVAGKGDAEREIREIFTSRNLADRLILLGNLSGDELADCYAAMDIFAFASQSETQGLVLVEAMAASTPVIALSASGVDDVLENGQNGTMLAANASTDDFAAALLAALNDPGQLASWRARTIETARKFSKEACTAQLVDLYERTLEKRHQPHSAEMEILDMALMAIKTEWELLQEKTVAALHSLFEDEEKE